MKAKRETVTPRTKRRLRQEPAWRNWTMNLETQIKDHGDALDQHSSEIDELRAFQGRLCMLVIKLTRTTERLLAVKETLRKLVSVPQALQR